jgi:3-aminobutyryl-CoA ammonia-lyase
MHVGDEIVHRRYVDFSHAHYAGNLVDGAFMLALFGDVATDLCMHLDNDEGLFAGYSEVAFRSPIRAGDVLEVSARIAHIGSRSRQLAFEARVLARSYPSESSPSAGHVLDEPLLAVSATGTVVVPAAGAVRGGVLT